MVVLAGPLVSSANLLLFSYETFACFYYMYFQPHLYVLSSDKASRIPSTRTATHAATTKEKLVFFSYPHSAKTCLWLTSVRCIRWLGLRKWSDRPCKMSRSVGASQRQSRGGSTGVKKIQTFKETVNSGTQRYLGLPLWLCRNINSCTLTTFYQHDFTGVFCPNVNTLTRLENMLTASQE